MDDIERKPHKSARQRGGPHTEGLRNILRATDALTAAGDGDRRFARLTEPDLIHTARNVACFRARYDDKPVIAKLFFGAKGAEQAQALTEQLQTLTTLSRAGGGFHIAPMVDAMPDKGMILTADIDGTILAQEIAATDRVATRRLPIREAGEWLAHYNSTTHSTGRLAARFWLRQCRQKLRRVNKAETHVLVQELLQKLHRLCASVQGAEVTRACSHGNFTPAKLIRHRGVLHGADIVNTNDIPIAKDLARFLVMLAVEMPGTGRRFLHGIQKTDYDALLSARGLISKAEQDLIMPFFIGIELIDRFSRMTGGGPCMQNLEAAITRFCEA